MAAVAKRSTRRWIVRAVVFLLLGAIVNVAVAWGLILFDSRAQSVEDRLLPSEEAEILLLQFFSRDSISRYQSTGWTFTSGGWQIKSAAAMDVQNVRVASFGSYVPAVLQLEVMKAGWPTRTLSGTVIADQRDIDKSTVHYSWALETPDWASLPFVGRRFTYSLPLQPIWPGFAINTIFYAMILWALFATPFALRRWRRVRKGLCPKCAYPVGESDICTECGTVVRHLSG